MSGAADGAIGVYRRHARAFDRLRSRELFERPWLDRMLSIMPAPRRVLDIGCGMGEPVARYLIERGCAVTGVDTSPELLRLCRERFPGHRWIEQDMRELRLEQRFDAVIAFDSFFFLSPSEQREMFPRFAGHAADRAPLLFTSGPEAGVAWGSFEGERLHHASLSPPEYRRLLRHNGFDALRFVPRDPECRGHSVWLSRYGVT